LNGLLLGSHCGSIFGNGGKIRGYNLPIFSPASHFTDDCIFSAAICSELLSGRHDFETALMEWYLKYPNEEYSCSFWQWLGKGIDDSCGNGSAIRSIPAGYAAKSENEAIHLAQKISKITHRHHEGMCGAESVSWVIFKLKNDTATSFEEIKYKAYDHWGYYLDYDLEEVHTESQGSFTTAAWDTVPLSLYIGLKSDNVEDALRKCIWLGGDSMAAIACSVAELVHGGIQRSMMQKVYSSNVKKFNDVLLTFEQFRKVFCF